MKKEDIHITDINRILFGDAPVGFLAEVFVRTLILYLILLIILRLLGKRMSGQLTVTEISVMIMLGAIVGSPVQLPDRGVGVGVFILICVLIFQRLLTQWAFNNPKVENLTQGDMLLLVKDGVLQLEQMKKSNISRQQVFTQLRNKNILQLGAVKRMYLETCGIFSIYENADPLPGLPVLPPGDKAIQQVMKRVEGTIACNNCGLPQKDDDRKKRCYNCGQVKWDIAVT
jgi:uncharacterized membrane protein YcaP (DUF421 family)